MALNSSAGKSPFVLSHSHFTDKGEEDTERGTRCFSDPFLVPLFSAAKPAISRYLQASPPSDRLLLPNTISLRFGRRRVRSLSPRVSPYPKVFAPLNPTVSTILR